MASYCFDCGVEVSESQKIVRNGRVFCSRPHAMSTRLTPAPPQVKAATQPTPAQKPAPPQVKSATQPTPTQNPPSPVPAAQPAAGPKATTNPPATPGKIPGKP